MAIPIWLHEAASRYNSQSLANRDAYAAVLLMPIQNLVTILTDISILTRRF